MIVGCDRCEGFQPPKFLQLRPPTVVTEKMSYLKETYYRIREPVSSVLAEKKSTQFQIINCCSYRSPIKNVMSNESSYDRGLSNGHCDVFLSLKLIIQRIWTNYFISMIYRMNFHGVEGDLHNVHTAGLSSGIWTNPDPIRTIYEQSPVVSAKPIMGLRNMNL
jgi:hypothetical protein